MQVTEPLRVLVVDDHRDTAALTARVLAGRGHVVRTAGTCAAALALARAERFDVLLCDLTLPDGDGCGLLADVLRLHPVRAVAFTGRVAAADRRRAHAAGFHAYLTKPADLTALLAVVAGDPGHAGGGRG